MIWMVDSIGYDNFRVTQVSQDEEHAQYLAIKYPRGIYFFADLVPPESYPHVIHIDLSLVKRKSYPCYCGIFDEDHTQEALRKLLTSSERR